MNDELMNKYCLCGNEYNGEIEKKKRFGLVFKHRIARNEGMRSERSILKI